MTDASSAFVTLRTDRVQLTLAAALGSRASILYWGKSLRSAGPQELALLATRQWAFGGPTAEVSPSLSNELGAGLGGPSGFLAHRDGTDWATVFAVERIEQPDADTVVLHCGDTNLGVGMCYQIALDPVTDMLSIVSTVTNRGDEPLTVDWATVAAMPLDQRLTRLWGFTGRWAGEFEPEEISAHRGSYVRENKSGRTSHDSFPGLIALAPSANENAGPCAGFHLGWSGNSRVRADRHSDGRSFVQMGELFFPGEMKLEAGTSYTTPTLYAAWSEEGLNGLSRGFHRHLRERILNPRTKGKPRPVHYNTWEAVYFDHSEEKLMTLADQAASVGAERFVLDDGWFGGRRNDRTGLGDWQVSKEIYPNGLGRLVEHVRGLGMEFGIWFEPEMVNPDSDLFRAHPDWILEASGVEQVPFRQQYTLDLTRRDVTDYLFDAISKIVAEYDVNYIKWDMNRDITHPGSLGGRAAVHRQTRAVYALIGRLREAHPDLEIESCASGGGRADFGILAQTDRLWTSDNNDALSRQRIQRGASHFFPPQVLGSHVGPKTCHITGRVFDMEFRVGTAILGHMGMEVDLSTETEADLQVLRRGIALYKEHRSLIHSGDVYRLDAASYVNGTGVVAEDKSEALFSCAKVDDHSTTLPERLLFAGIAPEKAYRLRILWLTPSPSITVPSVIEAADLLGEGHVFSGEALLHHGIQFPLVKPNTCLIYHLEATMDQ
ncbi:MAG: alpha-galactosidase [Pseudomonadota bacterium]